MTKFILLDATGFLSSVQILWAVSGLIFILLCVLILRQRRQGKQLRKELAELDKLGQANVEYEFVLKAMKIAVWRYDSTTHAFVYENDYREGKSSYVPRTDETYKETLTAIAPADVERVNRAFNDICEGRTDYYHQEYQVMNMAAGTSYWEESYATVVDRDADGKPSKIIGTSQRIDERKEMEADLIYARNKAEESDRLKTAFLANMGHEIRTPLNAIVGFADLLPVVQDENDRNQLIAEIQANNSKLLRIINGLVSMSEIEAGARSLSMTAVDLNQLFTEMAAKSQPSTDVPILTHLPEAQMLIHSDREVLTEIVDHLMQNAIKFTTSGSITLGYDVEGDQIRIWVLDTGKGVAKADQERIFERFVKVDEYIPGTGLGLSVVKSHATHLNGTVGVESELGQGSRFWVLLPIT